MKIIQNLVTSVAIAMLVMLPLSANGINLNSPGYGVIRALLPDTKAHQTLDLVPLFPGLEWRSEGRFVEELSLYGVESLIIPGEIHRSEKFTGKPSGELLNYYLPEQMSKLGWSHLAYIDHPNSLQINYYHFLEDSYLFVRFEQCDAGSLVAELEFCALVWVSEPNKPLPAPPSFPRTSDDNEIFTPATMYYQNPLPVPFFSQRLSDPANNIILGFGTSCTSTIHNYGCALTSYAMIYNYYQVNFTNPVNLNESMKVAPGQYVCSDGCCNLWPITADGSTLPDSPSGLTAIHRYPNNCTTANCIDAANVTIIDNEINAGRPMHARVHCVGCAYNSHSIVIVGHVGSDYYIKDSWALDDQPRTLSTGALGAYVVDFIDAINGTPPGSTSCDPGSNDVALYVDANYTGQCVVKGLGEYPNPSSIGLPNDSVSSVKVGSNVKAVLCKDDNYAGGCEEFSGDDGNLGDNSIGNDQVSSLKVQYRTSGGPVGYTWCANEGGYCSFSGTADVAYGANGSFYYKYGIVGGIACNNDVFGDPAYGVSKACYYKNVASTTGSWTADYYDEHTRWWDTNNTANFRCSEAAGSGFLDKNYGAGAPCGMNGDVWVGDYHGTFNFSSGNYVFWIDHDDGLKLWLNGANIADRGGSGSSYVCPSRYLSGDQNLRAMLREDYGDARIKVSWTTDTSVCNPPPAPSNVQASDGTFTDKIQVTWNTSTGAKLYEVYRATSADGTKSKISSPTATTYDDTSAAAGTTYYYWVKACSDYGCSDYSAYNTGYLASLAPAAPSNLYSINTTLTTITFGWQDNSTNETGFNVYRWRDGDHGWDFYSYDNVGANVTNYTDSDLSCGYANFYLVTAYNAHGESERSGWIMMRTRLCTPLLNSPENGATLPNATEVELDWAAGDYATGYYARLWGGPDIDINSGWISDTLWHIGQLWPGTYNWQVKARDENAQESDLSEIWSFTVAPPCTDDGYEDNDLYENAVTLGAGYYPGLQICAGDDDWFSLSLAKGQQARIHLDFSHALGDLDAELCVDQSCDPPLAVGYSATDDELLIYRAVASGVYRLRIFGFGGDANNYNLSLKIENLLFLPDLYRP